MRTLLCLVSFFMFMLPAQAQMYRFGWFYPYYNNGYYNNYRYYQQQPRTQQTASQSQSQTQKKQVQQPQSQQPQNTNTSSTQQKVDTKASTDYPYVYNPANVSLTDAEKYIVSEVNKLRARYRLPPLVVSPALMNSARAQTNMMRSYGMRHGLVSRPYGASENIASTSSASYAMSMWIGSSGHFANMTSGSSRFIGVGCFGGYSTQEFSSYSDVAYSLVQPKAQQEASQDTEKKEELKEENTEQSADKSINEEKKAEDTENKESTENNENRVTQNKKTSLSMFTVKPLPEGAYIDKVPVEGGVPGEYMPVLKYRD